MPLNRVHWGDRRRLANCHFLQRTISPPQENTSRHVLVECVAEGRSQVSQSCFDVSRRRTLGASTNPHRTMCSTQIGMLGRNTSACVTEASYAMGTSAKGDNGSDAGQVQSNCSLAGSAVIKLNRSSFIRQNAETTPPAMWESSYGILPLNPRPVRRREQRKT